MSADIIASFKGLINHDVAVPVAAMNALVLLIKQSTSSTWMQLEIELRQAIGLLKSNSSSEDLGGRTSVSLGSGCELFMKYVTRAFNIEDVEFKSCKEELVRRGEKFAGMSLTSRTHIANIGNSFVQDGFTVLTHGNSRVVTALLLGAANSNRQFNVIITEGMPDIYNNENTITLYRNAGIPTTLIPDCAVASIMEQVDLCLVGAEGVMENGGIINKVGTYQIAIVAKALKKPFYVAVESYKFARMYPLSQRDVADLYQKKPTAEDNSSSNDSVGTSPVDFTPAEYISLLFTDLGVLTPAAVSDELIKLYQ